MFISASRRTDIPAFFPDWFLSRVDAGYFYQANPFNPRQISGYSLLPEDVDTIVFWSKNPRPLMRYLDKLDSAGYRYYFQFTLNDYSRGLEPNVPPLRERLDTFWALSDRLGPARVIWRYDPIVISSCTPVDYHLGRIETLARCLKGYSGRLVFSLLDFYGKVAGRLEELSRGEGISFEDITLPEYSDKLLELAKGIRNIATSSGFEVYSCAEKVDLSLVGVKHGACIDGELIQRLFGIERPMKKDRGQRPECLCVESVDVGAYNTCRHQCAYCYANSSEASFERNLAGHVPDGGLLVGECGEDVEIRRDKGKKVPNLRHQSMFE